MVEDGHLETVRVLTRGCALCVGRREDDVTSCDARKQNTEGTN
jgi:hypothetical protein